MKGKKAIFLVLLVFLLPVIAAKLSLHMGWYNKGVTNQGELLSQPLSFSWLPSQGQWRLLYVLPEACDSQCDAALFQLSQIPVAIGREHERVSSVLLSRSAETPKNISLPHHQLLKEQADQLHALPHLAHAIYLVDPLNNVILAYPIPVDEDARITQSKGLMKDLKKLMKLSKVG